MTSRLVAGKYTLTRMLGRGGMGEVHEATHSATGRRVAIKLLRHFHGQDGTESDDTIARFQREARATGAMSSPHIVQVLDAGQDDLTHEPFMVMEYLEGADVNETLRRLGPLPVELALSIIAQACIGLARAHEAGIVHRDIKPANLYLARDGTDYTVKVLDFGVARMKSKNGNENGDATNELTNTGTMLGSPHYMAPEQARGLKTVDARADIWSLGVVLYKLLSGKTPHTQGEGGIGDLLIAICFVPAPPIQNEAPWVPAEVADLLRRALRINPAERFASVREMLAEVTRLLPRGSKICDEMLVPLSEAQRSHVEPVLADSSSEDSRTDPHTPLIPIYDAQDGDTRGTMSKEMTGTDVALSATPPSRGRRRLIVALGAVAILAAGIGLYAGFGGRHQAQQGIVATGPASSASVDKLEVSNAATAAREVAVYVTPGATVDVDGVAAAHADDGTVVLSGLVGSTRRVHASLGGKDVTTIVSLTDHGAVPPAVIVPTENRSAMPLSTVSAAKSATHSPATPAASGRGASSAAKLTPVVPKTGALRTDFE